MERERERERERIRFELIFMLQQLYNVVYFGGICDICVFGSPGPMVMRSCFVNKFGLSRNN